MVVEALPPAGFGEQRGEVDELASGMGSHRGAPAPPGRPWRPARTGQRRLRAAGRRWRCTWFAGRWPTRPRRQLAYGSTRRFGGLRCFLRVCVAVPSEPVSCSSVRGLPEMLGRSRARFARAPWFASVRRLVSRIDRCSEVAAGDRSLPVPCRAFTWHPATSVGQPGSPGLVGRNAELDRLRAHRADRVGALPTG